MMTQEALNELMMFCDEMMITEESFTNIGAQIDNFMGQLKEGAKNIKAKVIKVITRVFEAFIAWLRDMASKISGLKARKEIVDAVNASLDKVFEDNNKLTPSTNLPVYAELKVMQASMLKGEVGATVNLIKTLNPSTEHFVPGVSTQKRFLQLSKTFEGDLRILRTKIIPSISDKDGNIVESELLGPVGNITMSLSDMQTMLQQLLNMCYVEKHGIELSAPILD